MSRRGAPGGSRRNARPSVPQNGSWELIATWPSDIASWTDVGTPTESGTLPITTGDDDTSGVEGHQVAVAPSFVNGRRYRFRVRIQKAVSASHWGRFQLDSSTSTIQPTIQYNSQTGQTNVIASTGTSGLTVTMHSNPADWVLELVFAVTASAGPARLSHFPAIAAASTGSTNATTGSVTWYPNATLERYK